MIKGYAVLIKNEVRHFYRDYRKAHLMARKAKGQVWQGLYTSSNVILFKRVV